MGGRGEGAQHEGAGEKGGPMSAVRGGNWVGEERGNAAGLGAEELQSG